MSQQDFAERGRMSWIAHANIHIDLRQIWLLNFVDDHDSASFQYADDRRNSGLGRKAVQNGLSDSAQPHVSQRSMTQGNDLQSHLVPAIFAVPTKIALALQASENI